MYEVSIAQGISLENEVETLVVVEVSNRESIHDLSCHFGPEDLTATGRQEGP